VQKLLRSPRPPTSEDEKKTHSTGMDSKFDSFSEHNPRAKGLNQLYIPPVSPKLLRQSNASAASPTAITQEVSALGSSVDSVSGATSRALPTASFTASDNVSTVLHGKRWLASCT
jgi:hypothetical protein